MKKQTRERYVRVGKAENDSANAEKRQRHPKRRRLPNVAKYVCGRFPQTAWRRRNPLSRGEIAIFKCRVVYQANRHRQKDSPFPDCGNPDVR
jgi:hypothetical protein